MPEHRPPRRWALVMDKTRAQIIDLSPAHGIAERVKGFVFRNDQRQLRRIISDTSGHAIERLRSGYNSTDRGANPIHADDREFLNMVLQAVHERAEANEFDVLVLAAASPVLNEIKTIMPASLRLRVEREFRTDMASLPTSDVKRRLLLLIQS